MMEETLNFKRWLQKPVNGITVATSIFYTVCGWYQQPICAALVAQMFLDGTSMRAAKKVFAVTSWTVSGVLRWYQEMTVAQGHLDSPLEGHQSSSRTGIRSYRMTSNSHFWFYDQTNWNRLDEGQMAFNGTSGHSSAPCSLPGIATRKAGLSLVLFLSRASSHWAHDRH